MNTIDELFSKQAQDLTNAEIDLIIIKIRERLAAYDSGIKPKREAEENLNLNDIVAKISQRKTGVAPAPAKPASKMKRRF